MKCYYTTRDYGMSLVRGRTYERLTSGTLLGCRVVLVQSYGRASQDPHPPYPLGVLMYMLPDMIDMGLKPRQKWPTSAHRQVAQTIGLCNSLVTTRDALTEVVQAVRKVPKSRIKKVTSHELAGEFSCPYIHIRLS